MNLNRLKFFSKQSVKIIDESLNLEENLNSLIADELQAWFQYYSVYLFLQGSLKDEISKEFKKHAEEELKHSRMLLEFLQKNNIPFNVKYPEYWKEYSKCQFEVTNLDTNSQCLLNLDAENCAIKHYTSVLSIVSDNKLKDIIKEILKDEEEHKDDLTKFLKDIKEYELKENKR